jgi:hypothetical protein
VAGVAVRQLGAVMEEAARVVDFISDQELRIFLQIFLKRKLVQVADQRMGRMTFAGVIVKTLSSPKMKTTKS